LRGKGGRREREWRVRGEGRAEREEDLKSGKKKGGRGEGLREGKDQKKCGREWGGGGGGGERE
jgi:hypothetical protein